MRHSLAQLALLCGFVAYNVLFNPVRPARVRRYFAKKLRRLGTLLPCGLA